MKTEIVCFDFKYFMLPYSVQHVEVFTKKAVTKWNRCQLHNLIVSFIGKVYVIAITVIISRVNALKRKKSYEKHIKSKYYPVVYISTYR